MKQRYGLLIFATALALSACQSSTQSSQELPDSIKSLLTQQGAKIVQSTQVDAQPGTPPVWSIQVQPPTPAGADLVNFYAIGNVLIQGNLWNTKGQLLSPSGPSSPAGSPSAAPQLASSTASTATATAAPTAIGLARGKWTGKRPEGLEPLAKLVGIQDGNAPPEDTVYIFFDPRCPYCHEAFQKTRNAAQKGVGIKWIPTVVLGSSADAIQTVSDLLAQPTANSLAQAFAHKPIGTGQKTPPSQDTLATLSANETFLRSTLTGMGQAVSVPTAYYLNKQTGQMEVMQGASDDQLLRQIFGD